MPPSAFRIILHPIVHIAPSGAPLRAFFLFLSFFETLQEKRKALSVFQ
jgi:hypothetical protein